MRIILLLFFINCQLTGFAQGVSKTILERYPLSVAKALYEDYGSKVLLCDSSQQKLANEYLLIDQKIKAYLANPSVAAPTFKRYADSLKWGLMSKAENLLTPKEWRQYALMNDSLNKYGFPFFNGKVYPDAEMASQFGLAIKMRKRLALIDSQCIKLLLAATELGRLLKAQEANPDAGYFDRAAFESQSIEKILMEYQYTDVIAHKNKDVAKQRAGFDWAELNKRGIATGMKKDTVLFRLNRYYLMRAHLQDRFAHQQERATTYLKMLKMPQELRILQDARLGQKMEAIKHAW
jgi:hypothetical protein